MALQPIESSANERKSRKERKSISMSTSQVKSFNAPDETRTPPKAKMEIVNFGDMSIVRMICEPGWKWSEHMRPIAGTDSCQGTHFTYIISGHFRTVMDDGTVDELGPGDIAITPPGHDAYVVGNEPCVLFDFQGASRNG
jgi:hypothetical protein